MKTSFKITLLGLIQPVSMKGVEMHYLEGPDYGRFTFLRVSMKEEKTSMGLVLNPRLLDNEVAEQPRYLRSCGEFYSNP